MVAFYLHIFGVGTILLMLHSGQRWLRRILPYVSDCLRHVAFDSWLSKPNVVYVILSPVCKHFYVGMSSNGARERMFGHLVAERADSDSMKVHGFMKRFGTHMFTVLPLAFTDCASDLPRLETCFIRRLQPSLNVRKVKRTAGLLMSKYTPGSGALFISQRRQRSVDGAVVELTPVEAE